ncbi:MAG: hypothetical protein UZ12_BCD005002176 [Bacteroidetes bacterium OLB12]|nr:MAG: hypothetical protein UZ12_BCD005002176 [Bacteroidetes bacterium OLB12]
MRSLIPAIVLLVLLSCEQNPTTSLLFKLSFTKEMSDQAQDGRLLLLLANNNKAEPRFQINDGLTTQLVFGLDVEGMQPGQEITLDASNAFGFPRRSINEIPAGEYYVQALINRYETFNLKTGHTVKLPPDQAKASSGIVSRATFTAHRLKYPSILPERKP